MTMGHIVCEKGIFFQYLGHLIYTHTKTRTLKHTRFSCWVSVARRQWELFVIIIQKRHIGAHLNWFHLEPVRLYMFVYVCVARVP